MLDEKEGTPFDIVGGIGFSSDSRRFGYAGADVNHGFGKQKAVGRTNIDGTAGPTFEGPQIGSLLKNMATASTPYLVVGYLPQLLSDTHGVTAPVFSPDGRRVAYAARRDKETSTVIVDGQPGLALPSIVAGPVFSPDSQHVAVVISEGDAKILVVDGVKTTGSAASGTDFILDLAFAANNRRGAYIGIDGGNMYEQGYTRRARRRVYVDGTPDPNTTRSISDSCSSRPTAPTLPTSSASPKSQRESPSSSSTGARASDTTIFSVASASPKVRARSFTRHRRGGDSFA